MKKKIKDNIIHLLFIIMSDELEYPQEGLYFNILPEGVIDIIMEKVKKSIHPNRKYFFWHFKKFGGFDLYAECLGR